MIVGEYNLVNEEKVERAIKGSTNAEGIYVGGVQKEDGSYEDAALIAEYDRLGGLITRENDKIKTGSFYDFKAKRPRAVPEVFFVYRVNDKEVEVPDGKELPGLVRAAKILAENKEVKKVKKSKKDE